MDYPRCLEVKVISAESLSFPIATIGKNAFVVVSTSSSNGQSTATDHHGGAYPSWNESLTVPFPPQVRSLDVDVRCKTALGVKTIGRSKIPATDFVGVHNVPCGYLHFLSYRLLDKEGRRNGIINLSVKVITWLPGRILRPSAPLSPLPDQIISVMSDMVQSTRTG